MHSVLCGSGGMCRGNSIGYKLYIRPRLCGMQCRGRQRHADEVMLCFVATPKKTAIANAQYQ